MDTSVASYRGMCACRDYDTMLPARGATENARHENTGQSKMQGWKMRDMKMRHHVAGVENARHEFAAPTCKGGKCET